jgi:hypothetical protein
VSSTRVLPPILLLSVSDNPTGTLTVEVRDAAGNVISPKSVHFSSSNPNVATASDAGVVTAVSSPRDFGSTPYVTAIVDGAPSENVVVVRVTQTSLGLTLDPFWGRHVTFYVPREPISGFNYQQILRDYDVVRITDIAYELEWEASGVVPFDGNTQFLVNDPGHGADGTVPCGLAGNPIRLGSDVDKPIHNSCMIVASDSGTPQWGVFFHEMGHNFLGVGAKTSQFMSGHSNDFVYSEGLATSLGMYAAKMLQLRSASYKNSQQTLDNIVSSVWHFGQTPDLDKYIKNGTRYDQMTPSALDDMIDTVCAQYGYERLYRFHSLFLPHNTAFPFAVDSDAKQATLFVAAFSAATGIDLRTRFKGWGFPMDNDYYGNIWNDVTRLVSQRAHGPEAMLFKPRIDGLTVTANGVTLPGIPDVKVTRIHLEWGDGYSEDNVFPVSHTYATSGTYTIVATAHQSDGLSTERSRAVTVPGGAVPPSLDLFAPEVDGLKVTVNGVTLPGTADAKVVLIHWDWGDGYSEDHWFPASHIYASPGSYPVTVTSYQDDGSSMTRIVSVSAIPEFSSPFLSMIAMALALSLTLALLRRKVTQRLPKKMLHARNRARGLENYVE